jgi:transcriptional regulator with XRE-family HTH domain
MSTASTASTTTGTAGPTSTAGLPGLRAAREAQLLTQIDLAERSGINRSTISDLESGSRNAHFRTIRQLAAALDVAPQNLLVGPPGRKRPARARKTEEATATTDTAATEE